MDFRKVLDTLNDIYSEKCIHVMGQEGPKMTLTIITLFGQCLEQSL